MKKIILFICLLLTINLVIGQTKNTLLKINNTSDSWFVRPLGGSYGSENGTDYSNAWDGFSDIEWDLIKPSDTLYICGTHVESITIPRSGRYRNPIIISGGYALDTGIINVGFAHDECMIINNKHYLKIIDLSLKNANISCLLNEGTSDNIEVERVIASGSGNQGFQNIGNVVVIYRDIEAYNCVDDGLSQHNNSRCYIYGCYFHDNSAGINTIENSYTLMYNATVINNTLYAFQAVQGSHLNSDTMIVIGFNSNGRIYARDSCYIKLEYGYNTNSYADHNCVAEYYSNMDINYCIFDGIYTSKFAVVAKPNCNITVRNSVFYDSDKNGSAIYSSGTTTVTAINCIFNSLKTCNQQTSTGVFNASYCCYYYYDNKSLGVVTITNDKTTDPKFYNVSNHQFWLTTGSSCINTGLNTGTTYKWGLDATTTFNPLNIVLVNQSLYSSYEIGAYVYH